MDNDRISQELAKALSVDINIIVGTSTGVKPDGTTNVVSGGRSVNAIATGAIPSGSNCIAVRDGNNWYAIGESPGQVVGERVMRSRKYKQQSKPQQLYPFKVLFSIVEDGMQKFYVGGDRSTPELIYQCPATENIEAWLTNTGTGKDDWRVSIKMSTTILAQ